MGLLVLLFFLLELQQPLAQTGSSFSFENFSNIQSNDLQLTGNAFISPSSLLRLTSDNLCSYGRAMKPEPISFCDNNSPLSFTTEFRFLIQKKDSTKVNADGLTFFIAPTLTSPSNESSGRWLGFVEPSESGKISNHLVGIEFDTYQNASPDYFPEIQDIDENHVGIDVNGIISLNASSLTNYDIFLGGGRPLAARITYDSSVQQLSVFVSSDVNFTNMGEPVLEHNINLCVYIKSTSYVGLSAGSGCGNVDFHNIYSWRFTTGRVSTTSGSPVPGTSGSPVPTTSSEAKEASFKLPFLVSVSLGGAALLLLFSSCLLLRKKKHEFRLPRKASSEELVPLPREIEYSDIVRATQNFSERNLLGTGGFGSVYKGILPGDDSPVAVKRVSENSQQGEREFLTEVKIISSLRHRNLVKLRGWCRKKENELILVYEFMPQGSLEQALFKNKAVLLLWGSRYNIICGLAAALLYLHEEWEQQVLHRDIKCSNVMLDGDFNARLGDFGLARVLEPDRTSRTTTLAGTLGYIAPEVGYTYKFTPASDVYSFGVVALEVVCGQEVVNRELLLVPWVQEHAEGGTLISVVDPRLHQEFNPGILSPGELTGIFTRDLQSFFLMRDDS